jgi:hypothetical protein
MYTEPVLPPSGLAFGSGRFELDGLTQHAIPPLSPKFADSGLGTVPGAGPIMSFRLATNGPSGSPCGLLRSRIGIDGRPCVAPLLLLLRGDLRLYDEALQRLEVSARTPGRTQMRGSLQGQRKELALTENERRL